MRHYTQYSLKSLNTFGFECIAKDFIEIDNIDNISENFNYIDKNFDVIKLLENRKFLVIGKGSNLILANKFFDGLVIYISDKNLDIINENILAVSAGYVWHDLVEFCLNNKYYGLENLALIPGTVGASPIQNIGAYGVEVQQFIDKIQVYNLQTKAIEFLSNVQCKFSYRDSIFKHTNQYIVLKVFFKFTDYTANISYKELSNYLNLYELEVLPQNIFKAVVYIRNQKLPKPEILGNAGSFFKNPIIETQKLQNLLNLYPKLINYPIDNNYTKLAAGWLIDNCNFKGYKYKQVGVYEKQALVLVNYTAVYANEILELASLIQQTVLEKFDIQLEIEPIIIN